MSGASPPSSQTNSSPRSSPLLQLFAGGGGEGAHSPGQLLRSLSKCFDGAVEDLGQEEQTALEKAVAGGSGGGSGGE